MNFELWLKELANFLVASGVPAEHGSMAALALVYLSLTLFALLIVAFLLKKNLLNRRKNCVKNPLKHLKSGLKCPLEPQKSWEGSLLNKQQRN